MATNKDELVYMKKFFYKIPCRVWLLLILLLLSFFTLPPWKKYELLIGGKLNISDHKIDFAPSQTQFKYFLNRIGFPISVDHYNLHIENRDSEYLISRYIGFDKSNPILPFLEEKIPSAKEELGVPGHKTFLFEPDTNYHIKSIPVEYSPLDRSEIFGNCGDNQTIRTKCSEAFPLLFSHSSSTVSEQLNKSFLIYATQDFWVWFINFILMTAFLVVVVQNIRDFLKSD